MPPLNPAETSERAQHDALVTLVDIMLALVPKLRTQVSQREKSIIENAVHATDRKIDDLVCDLYGLTDEERAMIEAPAPNGSAL